MRRVYRSRMQLVCAVVAAAIYVLILVGLVSQAASHGLAAVALTSTYSIVIAAMLVRLGWAAIFCGVEAIRVANLFSSFELGWDRIDHFEIGRWKMLGSVCLIHLKDGSIRHAFGIQESRNFPNGSARQLVAELNERLRVTGLPERGQPELAGR